MPKDSASSVSFKLIACTTAAVALLAAGLLQSSPAVAVGAAAADVRSRACPARLQLVGVKVNGRPVCTHGDDSSTSFYAAAASSRGGGGGKKAPAPSPSPSPSPTATSAPSGARCGSEGSRVQALYVRAADVTDRYSALLPSLRQWAADVDSVFATSAAETGGVRRVRFVTDASCVPSILNVTVSSAGDDSLSSTITELQAQGYGRTDRKYLLWVDATVYCGIATVDSDDSSGASNRNNSGPSYGRTDAGCWGGVTEAHELVHTLGGVQLSSPHSDGGWHCTDEFDLMCYETGGQTMTYPCPLEHDRLLDCGHDDYFSTAPVQSSYLATHWNTANSVFLTSTA